MYAEMERLRADVERLTRERDVILALVTRALNECPDYPCRVDEMMPRERQIAAVSDHLSGRLRFVQAVLLGDRGARATAGLDA